MTVPMSGPELGSAAGAAGAFAALALLMLPSRGEQARSRLRGWGSSSGAGAGSRVLRLPARARPSGWGRGWETLEVADLAEQLAAAFRAGLPPVRAWEILAGRPGTFAVLADAVARRIGVGMPSGRSLWQAAGPERLGIVPLAAAVDLCERSGAPTADVLEGLAAGLRAEAAAASDARIALAAPRATATVMSVLPIAGLGLAALLGVDTVHVLLATAPGHACLVLGGMAWALGWWWIRRLVAAAQQAGDDDS
jgi:tight adherence protein B